MSRVWLELLVLPLLLAAAQQRCELSVGEETVQPNEEELVRVANERLVRNGIRSPTPFRDDVGPTPVQ